MRLAMGLATIALALAGCDWMERPKPKPRSDVAKARLEQVRKACASNLTYARLKEYVFDEAAQIRSSDPRRFDALAAYSVVRMEHPVVKSRDEDLNVIVCSGRFVLNLPPGVADAFNGQPLISADVEYAAQAAADGSGLVYSMNGAEPIIYRLATLGLSAGATPQIAAGTDQATEPVTKAPDPSLQAAAPQPPPPNRPSPAVARAESKPPPAPQPRPAPSRTAAAPSFDCARARTASEKMVCGNGALAAADRRMSAVFYGEMAGADPATKSALRRTRDRFLRTRERCSTDACVAQVYAERVAEIRRIANR